VKAEYIRKEARMSGFGAGLFQKNELDTGPVSLRRRDAAYATACGSEVGKRKSEI
jgi:hypothetical protein